MKVIIDNELINLKKVIRISAVYESKGDYSFTIYFVNRKSYTKSLSWWECFKQRQKNNSEEVAIYQTRELFIEHSKEAKIRIEQARENLINLWNKKKKEIPIIEI